MKNLEEYLKVLEIPGRVLQKLHMFIIMKKMQNYITYSNTSIVIIVDI